MIRQPTSPEVAFAWHRAACEAYAGLYYLSKTERHRRYIERIWADPALIRRVQISEDDPQCGFFRRQLVKGGPWVDARIYLWQVVDLETGELSEPEGFVCEIADMLRDADKEWTYLAGEPIPESEFNFIRDNRRWAMRYSPHESVANPMQPVDHLTTPLLF